MFNILLQVSLCCFFQLRMLLSVKKKFTVTHKSLLEDLLALSTSRYSEVSVPLVRLLLCVLCLLCLLIDLLGLITELMGQYLSVFFICCRCCCLAPDQVLIEKTYSKHDQPGFIERGRSIEKFDSFQWRCSDSPIWIPAFAKHSHLECS